MDKIVKNNILLIVLIGFFSVIILGAYNSRLVSFNKSFEGIVFSLNDSDYIKTTVVFEGKISKPVIGHKRFEGNILYDQTTYPCILILKDNFDNIATMQRNSENSFVPTTLYVTDDFDNIVLVISEKNEQGQYEWDNVSGKVFVSSANSVNDGYKMMKELLD